MLILFLGKQFLYLSNSRHHTPFLCRSWTAMPSSCLSTATRRASSVVSATVAMLQRNIEKENGKGGSEPQRERDLKEKEDEGKHDSPYFFCILLLAYTELMYNDLMLSIMVPQLLPHHSVNMFSEKERSLKKKKKENLKPGRQKIA